MNTARPPFQINHHQSAEDAAVEIVRVFQSLKDLPDKVSATFRALSGCLEAEDNNPHLRAGLCLSEAIDQDPPHFDLPYHNRQHTCEVMLCSRYLALILNIDRQATLEIILAALFHDYHHDGNGKDGSPFRLERRSIDLAEPYLTEAGLTSAQCRKLAAMVLATYPSAGLPVAKAFYAHYLHDTPRPEIPREAPELAELDDFDSAKQALTLCLADILPSLGLTIDHALYLQEQLAQEWDTTLGTEDKVRFIDQTQHLFTYCDRFIPNIYRLRNHLIGQRPADAAG